MAQKIKLITTKNVSEFTDVANGVDKKVTLIGIGKDENGKDWIISGIMTRANGKSLRCLVNLLLAYSVNRARNNPAHKADWNVDWNTITCTCKKDIYSNIKKWAVSSVME